MGKSGRGAGSLAKNNGNGAAPSKTCMFLTLFEELLNSGWDVFIFWHGWTEGHCNLEYKSSPEPYQTFDYSWDMYLWPSKTQDSSWDVLQYHMARAITIMIIVERRCNMNFRNVPHHITPSPPSPLGHILHVKHVLVRLEYALRWDTSCSLADSDARSVTEIEVRLSYNHVFLMVWDGTVRCFGQTPT